MTTTTFTTEPFTCPSCIKKIEGVVGRLDGVADVRVLFHSDKVKVTHDEQRISPEEVAATITGLGYPVRSHKSRVLA